MSLNKHGKIIFDHLAASDGPARYVCLRRHDREELPGFLQSQWGCSPPKLMISLIGGDGNTTYYNDLMLGQALAAELIDIAIASGAWISTPGYNEGIYRILGESRQQYADVHENNTREEIKLVGITSLDSVAGNEHIISGRSEVEYSIHERLEDCGSHLLEPNHSHFIFLECDEASVVSGGNITDEFQRIECEKTMSKINQSALVRVLFGGNAQSIKLIAHSIKQGTPLVVINGSGGSAALVDYLLNNETDRGFDERALVKFWSEIFDNTELNNEDKSHLRFILQHRNMVTFTELSDSNEGHLASCLIFALSKEGNSSVSKMRDQLLLALALNQTEYAAEVILNSRNPQHQSLVTDQDFLQSIFFDALIDNKEKIVRVLIDNGIQLSLFVTRENLAKLYETVILRDNCYSRFLNSFTMKEKSFGKTGCCHNRSDLPRFLCPVSQKLWTVGKSIEVLLDYIMPSLYEESNLPVSKEDDMDVGIRMSHYSSSNDKMLKDSAQHLFLWSILLNRMELAKIFLQSSQDNIACAIVGASLLRALSKFSGDQEDYEVRASYNRNSMYMEEIATELLNTCWQKDRRKTAAMLVREAETWGNATVLSLAYNTGMEDFMAQPACYHKLSELWRGDISLSDHYVKIFLVTLCPILLPILTFNQSHEEDNSFSTSIEDHGDSIVAKKGGNRFVTCYVSAFFSTPFAKATYYTILCLFHLTVYTLLMTTELRNTYLVAPNVTYYNATYNLPGYCISYHCCCFMDLTGIGCLELLTYLCTLGFFLDDIRKIRDMESYSVIQNLKNWWLSFWNWVDALFYSLFFMGVCFRFTQSSKNLTESTLVGWTNWLWAMGLGMRYARFTQFFYAFEALGPKIIMIRHMMKDLILFMVIFCIFVFAFGTIELAVTSPRTPFSKALLFNITYRAYFQVYGELFLDDFRSEGGTTWLLVAVYLLLTNILLINLLIATFSYTFQQIQDKSDTLWRYNLYSIVYDHLHTPFIPVLGSLAIIIGRKRRGCRWVILDAELKGLRVKLSPEKNMVINKFLQLSTKSFFRSHVQTTSQHSTDDVTNVSRTRSQRFKEIERSSHRIEQRLSEIREDFRRDIKAELKGLLKQTVAGTAEQEHTRMRRWHKIIAVLPQYRPTGEPDSKMSDKLV